MKKKRIISLILSVLMLATLILPVDAFAEEYLEEYEEFIYEEPALEDYYYEEPVFEEFMYEDFVVDEPVFEDLAEDQVFFEDEEDAQADEAGNVATINEETAYFELFDTTVYDASSIVTITKQPENAKANVGDTANFSVEASGVSGYQWQWSKTGTSNWRNCGEASATTANYEVGVTAGIKPLYFRCVLTGTDGTTEYTDVVRIEDAGLTITKQPENAKANVGDTANFSVEASGVSGYQWQWSKTGTSSWKNCGEASATTANYEVGVTAGIKPLYFRCVLTGTDGTTEYTNVVRIENANIVSEPFVFKIIEGTNNLTLIAYTGNASNVEVPGSVNGMTVTEIGVSPLADGEKGVFEGNTTLTSIKLPNTITAIREKSFKGCTNLSTMTTY